MCENCGINHETSELEDQAALSGFLDRLVFNELGSNSDPEPITSYMEERKLTPELELTGELYGKPWAVRVAQIPLDQIKEEDREHGSQWWAMDGYYDGELVRSTKGAPPEPVSAAEAAEIFAEYHFDYGM